MKTPAVFLLTIVAAFLLAIAATQLSKRTEVHAAGATLGMPIANCNAPGGATVVFSWVPLNGREQWLDLSIFDNGWEGGSFIGTGPMPGNQAAMTWPGITPGVPHVWRLNTLTDQGWVTSETGAFVPCGGPALLWGPMTCQDRFNVTLDFHWAPPAGGIVEQWLDLGFSSDFAPGTFAGAGPLPPGLQRFHWTNIQANTPTFFRVNALGTDGVWRSTPTAGFTAECAGPINPDLYASGDRLRSQRLGIDAPVNVRDVLNDGNLRDPAGPTDVVRYNFPTQEGYGGYPGSGGSVLLAGHVDFRDYGLAVFAPLRDVQIGDRFEYVRADGNVVTYQVDWFADLPPESDWNALARSSNPETLVLITCAGDFNFATREYSHRRAVRAIRVG